MSALLECRQLVKHFPIPRSTERVQAVNGVDISLDRGITLGLVGESGSGKTTIGKLILGLIEPTDGDIIFEGESLRGLTARQFRRFRPRIQAVFQDPLDSLDPRKRVGQVIQEPLDRMGLLDSERDRRRRVAELSRLVALSPALLDKYPHEISGGQQQKVGVARALASNPDFLVLDEPTSALSPSDRAELIAILEDLQNRLGVTYLFITHDLKVVETIADYVAVMYLGRLVETGPAFDVFTHPVHPYTQALLGSVLPIEVSERRKIRALEGEIPSPIDLPIGCAFASRCELAKEECRAAIPQLESIDGGQQRSACFRTSESVARLTGREGRLHSPQDDGRA